MTKIYEFYRQFCELQKATSKYRQLPQINKSKIFDKVLDFSNNDYLGLSKSKYLINDSVIATRKSGIGSTGSRLLSGNSQLIEEFEKIIAHHKGCESALIFNTGYQANISVLSSLLDESILKQRALVFFDKSNHASLYQGVFLSKAKLLRYKHNDMNHLHMLLENYKHDPSPKFIVTETVFGMDGDTLHIKEVFELAKKYQVFVYLDEAHATGMFGKDGYGLSSEINLNEIPHLVMGTFSKAIGVMGAYISCNNDVKNYIINKCPGFIYTTALPSNIIASALKGWKMIGAFGRQRKLILEKSNYLRNRLIKLGFNIGKSNTHIIPIIIENEVTLLKIQQELFDKYAIKVSAIRPPTVPPKSARLRIIINVKHSYRNIEYLLKALKSVVKHS